MTAALPPTERLGRHIQDVDNHWIWTAAKDKQGYGLTRVDGRRVFAHRAMYELHREPIPDGHVIDHLCRVPACCNPWHMRVVTQGVNIRDGLRGWGLTNMCRAGVHDVTDPANVTYRNERRVCKPCLQARKQAEHEARGPRGRINCPTCGREMHATSISRHNKTQHPTVRVIPNR